MAMINFYLTRNIKPSSSLILKCPKQFCVLLHQEYETITSFYVYLLVRKNVHTTSDHRLIYIRTLMCIVSKDEDRRYTMRGYALACKNGK